jgi:hypothetical protein
MLFMYVIFFSWCLLHVVCNHFLRSLSKVLASAFCWLCVGSIVVLCFSAICGFAYYILFERSYNFAEVHGETVACLCQIKFSDPCVHHLNLLSMSFFHDSWTRFQFHCSNVFSFRIVGEFAYCFLYVILSLHCGY